MTSDDCKALRVGSQSSLVIRQSKIVHVINTWRNGHRPERPGLVTRTPSKPAPSAPHGLRLVEEFLTWEEERDLLREFESVEFSDVEMRGQIARRKTAHFGWNYGYESWRITPGLAIPDFLAPCRARAATLAGIVAEEFAEVLVTLYPVGAGIGWHRDAPQFGASVVGVSLAGVATIKFRRTVGGVRYVYPLTLAAPFRVLDGRRRAVAMAAQHRLLPRNPLLHYFPHCQSGRRCVNVLLLHP